jgi:hypothetical protein
LISSFLNVRYQKVTVGNVTDSCKSSKWEERKNGVPQGSILGPLLFLFCRNSLPNMINNDNNLILFADDSSILVTDSNKLDFNININKTFLGMNTWFKDSLLFLNFNKTQYLEFRTKHCYNVNTEIKYDKIYI